VVKGQKDICEQTGLPHYTRMFVLHAECKEYIMSSFVFLCFTARTGKIHWNNNWVAFMDSMLQTMLFHADTRNLFVPIAIQRLSIDVKRHTACLQELGSVTEELGEIQTPYASCQPVADSGVHGNEALGTMEGREFLTYLSDCSPSEDWLFFVQLLAYFLTFLSARLTIASF
jgi:hypothetical protein